MTNINLICKIAPIGFPGLYQNYIVGDLLFNS